MTRPLALVTGGAGFIGSHTVDRLIATGYRVIVLDNLSTGKRANLARWLTPTHAFTGADPRLELVIADVSHGIFAPLAEVTARHGAIECIVHLAAQVSVVHSVANPLVDMSVNYGGTLHVLEYARAQRIRKVVLASSAAVYGDVDTCPVRETTTTQPMSPYGIDKLASEHALHCYSAVHGVPSTALRFFNVFGPRQDPSSPYSGVISIFAARARAGQPLTIFGDGLQSRDFVFVGDVARLIVTAATTTTGDRAVLNVGTGVETTVRQLAEAIVRLSGRGNDIHHAEARAGEIRRSLAATEAARALFDFSAEVSLDAGLQETLAWAAAQAG